MNRLESELFDLEELLMRNDGMADDSTYSTIVGIANDVSELETENAKLRELVYDMLEDEERGHNDDMTFREHVIRAHKYGIAKDIEV